MYLSFARFKSSVDLRVEGVERSVEKGSVGPHLDENRWRNNNRPLGVGVVGALQLEATNVRKKCVARNGVHRKCVDWRLDYQAIFVEKRPETIDELAARNVVIQYRV